MLLSNRSIHAYDGVEVFSLNEPVFLGAATALVTPFADDGIDFPALDRLLKQQLSAGIPALVVCGTTGEASTLTYEEKAMLWMHCVHFVDGACKIIAGVGTNTTDASIHLAHTAEKCGVDALLAVTPYYNKCTQQGLAAHYTAIADSTDLPLITYNVPSRTGVNLTPETCAALSKHPKISGVKEASGNLAQIAHICAQHGCNLWSGNDDQIVPIMSLGGRGVISVLSNVCPKAVLQMTQACLKGDYQTASALQLQYLPLIDALFCEVNPIPVKAALHALGLCKNILRLPLTPLSEEGQKTLLSAMEQCIN